LRLLDGPRENGHRPAVDMLFRSAAAAWDGSVTGVILSGSLDDGAVGLAAVAAAGGRAFVQDPEDALYASMPLNAIARVAVDEVLPADALGQALADRAISRLDDHPNGRQAMKRPTPERPDADLPGGSEGGAEAADRLNEVGENTDLTCPGCGGALWEIETDGVPVLRCHVGHAYGLESFEFEQSIALESALWTAVRALEEKQILFSRLGNDARAGGRDLSATSFLARAEGLQRQAEALRGLAESVMAAERGSEARSVPA
jgi:two-component system chemotaxis response regulator CheB